jgi:hypothetical protein
METLDESDIRTITQASPGSHSSRARHGCHVQVYDTADSLLSDTQRTIIEAVGGQHGEALRRTLSNNAAALQRTRIDADGTAAAMRLDVQEYISLLEGRFAGEFRELGQRLGRLINKGRQKRQSFVRTLKG